MKITKNIGKSDRAIRIALSIVIAVLGVYYHSWWGLLALPLIMTALVSWCGLYTLLGVRTCPPETPGVK
jgi:hypothetical protein